MAVNETTPLLPQIESLLIRLGAKTGFQLLSGFADRHGVWELRMTGHQARGAGFISFACDESPRGKLLKCELSAGFSNGTAAQSHVVGRFNLKTSKDRLDQEQTGLIERKFEDAVRHARPLPAALDPEADTAISRAYAIGK
jgi:hypothetical protein